MIIFQEAAGPPTPKVIPEPSLTKSFVKNLLLTCREECFKLAHSDLLFITDNSPAIFFARRSEVRRVGKECRSRWSQYH